MIRRWLAANMKFNRFIDIFDKFNVFYSKIVYFPSTDNATMDEDLKVLFNLQYMNRFCLAI